MEMSQSERVIYQALVNAAEAMRPCPKNDDLMGLIGASSDSTPPTIVRRLEEKGLIKVDRFQRSRRVYIVATDKWTPMPLNTAPHWRNRPQQVPSPSLQAVRERRPDIAAQIITRASQLGKPAVEFLADLVFVGWEVEKERG